MPSISVTNPELITSIDLGSATPKLAGVVDVSNFSTLETIVADNQDLTGFKGVENISALTSVDISDNKIVGDLPDFSSNTSSKIIDIRSNRYAGVLTTSLPTGIQSFKANNNNFAKVNVSGTVYSTIAHASSPAGNFGGGLVFTKADEETFTIVTPVSSGTSQHDYIKFVNSTNGIQVGKHRMTFDAVLNSGNILNLDVLYNDNDNDTTNTTYNNFKIREGSNVHDFEIFDDGVQGTSSNPDPHIQWRINSGAVNLNLSITNFKIIRDPVGYGPVGIHDFSTLTSLAEYQTANQSDSFGTSINTYGHASNANKVLNWSGPGELTNTSVDAGSIEGAIPESIRIINLENTNISKDSKRILLTQLYDTFKDKPTNWAKTTTVNGVTYSAPAIKAFNTRGTWSDTPNGTNHWQRLLGKHSTVPIGTAVDKLVDVGFTINGIT